VTPTAECALHAARGDEVERPRADLQLGGGDHLLALGTADQLEKLEALLEERA
jgi:Trk K+ transport system NAD-binding subunit